MMGFFGSRMLFSYIPLMRVISKARETLHTKRFCRYFSPWREADKEPMPKVGFSHYSYKSPDNLSDCFMCGMQTDCRHGTLIQRAPSLV